METDIERKAKSNMKTKAPTKDPPGGRSAVPGGPENRPTPGAHPARARWAFFFARRGYTSRFVRVILSQGPC